MKTRGKWVTRRMDPEGPSGGKIYEQGYECPVCGSISGSEYHCPSEGQVNEERWLGPSKSLDAMDSLEELVRDGNWGGMTWEIAKNIGVSAKNFMTYIAVDEHTQRNLLISLLSSGRGQAG